jgi:streptomycin 6-kinase
MNKLFEDNVINIWQEQGRRWLAKLPDIILTLSNHWSLENITPVENLSYNYVALATKDNRSPVVIKISCNKQLILDEYKALKHFNGVGCIGVEDINFEHNALLLEQAVPGDSLKAAENISSQEKINAYSTVVKTLSERSQANRGDYPHICDWLQTIDKTSSEKIPSYLIATAIKIKNTLLSTVANEVVLHGDLHLDNIILNNKKWIAIDPKGIIGELAFEPFVFDFVSSSDQNEIKTAAIALAESLNIDVDRLLQWTFVRAVLSACWFVEDNGNPGEAIAMAESVCLLIK